MCVEFTHLNPDPRLGVDLEALWQLPFLGGGGGGGGGGRKRVICRILGWRFRASGLGFRVCGLGVT